MHARRSFLGFVLCIIIYDYEILLIVFIYIYIYSYIYLIYEPLIIGSIARLEFRVKKVHNLLVKFWMLCRIIPNIPYQAFLSNHDKRFDELLIC